MMRDEDLSGTASTWNSKTNFCFFMRLKQRICTICEKIHLHHRLIPCILSKSADPKLIWGYCLDRFSPDENIVLAQQLKARKHTLAFFFSFFILWVYAWLVADIWPTSQWKSRAWFFTFSSLFLLHNWHALFHPFKVKVLLKHLSKQLNTSTNQNGKFFCVNLYWS